MVYLPDAELAELSGGSDLAELSGFALIVERGPRAGMTFLLKRAITTIGRDPDSDIFLNDVTVSRHHCRVSFNDSGLALTDSGSTNGTYLNGNRIEHVDLAVGDRVFVGKFHMVVAKGDV